MVNTIAYDDFVVVTITPVEGTAVVRVYGGYANRIEASKDARKIRKDNPGTQAHARKILTPRA